MITRVKGLQLPSIRQRAFYQDLHKHRAPDFAREGLFSHPYCGDFLQALYVAAFQDENQWCRDRPFKKARRQAQEITAKTLKAYAEKWWTEIDQLPFIGPFDTQAGDSPERAHLIVQRCADVLLHEGSVEAANLHLGTTYLLTLLIVHQRYNGTWAQFIRQFKAEGGKGETARTFARIFDLWVGRTKAPAFSPASEIPANPTPAEMAELLRGMERPIDDPRVTRIPVPDDCVQFCNDWMEAHLQGVCENIPAWNECVQSFCANEDQYAVHAERMWSEVRNHPKRYVVWPSGHDIVAIGVKELRNHGYRCIQLFGGDFPEFKARVWFELPLSRTMVYHDFHVKNERLEKVNDAGEILPGRRMMRYLCILAYWSVVTGQYAELRHKTRKRTRTVWLRPDGSRRRKPVRPHRPRLPAGKSPTEYAINRCRSIMHDEPGEGRTFAMAKDIEVAVREMLATEPDLNSPIFSLTELTPSMDEATT